FVELAFGRTHGTLSLDLNRGRFLAPYRHQRKGKPDATGQLCSAPACLYHLPTGGFIDNDEARHGPDPSIARHTLARHLPADRRTLSEGRRAAGLAQPVAHAASIGFAGDRAQRDERSRAARPHLRAAYIGRPASDAARPPLLRRRLHGTR